MTRPEGLPAERTVLAWDRTALALLGNGALLLVRDVRTAGPGTLVAAVVALVAALVVAVLGRRRARTLRHPAARPCATVALVAAGAAVLAVGVTVTAVLLVDAAW